MLELKGALGIEHKVSWEGKLASEERAAKRCNFSRNPNEVDPSSLPEYVRFILKLKTLKFGLNSSLDSGSRRSTFWK